MFKPLDRDAGEHPRSTCGIRKTSSRSRRRSIATYHMTQPAVFYNREDQWEIPSDRRRRREPGDAAVLHDHAAARRDRRPSSSRCCRSRRAGATTWRRGWWRAATASTTASCACSSSRSRSWCSVRARSSRASRRTRSISPQITLWNQQGSQVIWGTLMVIPIEESLIYVRPLYLRASGRPDSRADARHRRLREPDRDGGDARGRARAALRRQVVADRAPRPRTRPRAPPADAQAAQPERRHRRRTGARVAASWTALAAEAQRALRPRRSQAQTRRRLGDVRRGAAPARRRSLERMRTAQSGKRSVESRIEPS